MLTAAVINSNWSPLKFAMLKYFCSVEAMMVSQNIWTHFYPSLLNQAKKLVESLPQEIRANVSKEEAEKLKAALEAAGGTVVLE